MTYPFIIQFAVDNPWIAFFLSWPAMILILSVCWIFASTTTHAYNTTVSGLLQAGAIFVTLFRGYPPQSSSTRDEDDEDNEERT